MEFGELLLIDVVLPKLPFESQGAPTEFQRRPKMVPKGAQGAQRKSKGLRKEAQGGPKCPKASI